MNDVRCAPRPRAGIAALLAALLALVPASLLATAGPARADSAPAQPSAATPVTVSADALPTVQINGVVWSQTVVGKTVYAAGKFTSARPAGAAAGTSETPRGNLLAYDITTGSLITSFAPSLNAQALVVTASPDGSRIYVGGDFTTADGQTRNRIAAYDTATGALIASFHPSVAGQVRAIAATNSTVYVGGNFNAIGSASRTKLAAFSAATGALLPWAPVPGPGSTAGNVDPSKTQAQNDTIDYSVLALVVTGGGNQVVAAGRFDTMDGEKATGVAALDPTTGANRPFAVNQLITNQGINSAVYSLSTSADGNTVYGTAYDFWGPGNLEGAFEATADGGNIIEIDDCHGDTYSSFASGPVLYLSSHAHDCSNIGGFPEQNPRIAKFATAFTTTPTGTVGPNTEENSNFVGQPAPSPLDWFPSLSAGTFTGQYQAGWSVTGNDTYVAYGGEFPRVNGVGQQGLVRFAVPSVAPNKVGPAYSDGMTPTIVQMSGGVRVSWRSTSDQDNENLTYKVFRSDQPKTPIYQTTAPSTWWNLPTLGFVDHSAQVGSTYSYTVYAYDPFGNHTNGRSASVTVTASAAGNDLYGQTVQADSPTHFWRFDEPAGSTTSYDQTAFDDVALGTGVTEGVQGALTGSSDTAASFDGSSSGLAATGSPVQGPQVFSVEAWFKTTSTAGGKIVGFGNANSGTSSNYDRHVYMDTDGTVYFGVWTGQAMTVRTQPGLNDGNWHHVVATLGSGGLAMYLDGGLVDQRSDTTSAQDYSGYWRVGGDSSWAGANFFAGSVDDVAIYPVPLTAGQVLRHYSVGSTGQPYNEPPTASFTTSANGLTASFDASGSSDAEGPIASYAWDFGDGSTGSGSTISHTFAAAGSYRVTMTVTDGGGKKATASHVVTVVANGTAGGAYSQAVQADGASSYWRLGETSGPAFDSVGSNDMTVGSGVARNVGGAISGDPDGAASFDGTGSGLAVAQQQLPGPNTFSVEAWFKTTSTAGGKIVGFGNANSGTSSNYDRHVYMDTDGTVYFGVWTGQTTTVQSGPGFNDGKWHHVVASLGSGGLAMYLDGALVGRNTSTTQGQPYNGYWRVGGDNSWAGAPFFNGTIDDVAVYPTVLSDAQVARHYQLAGSAQPANVAPTAAFTSSTSPLAVTVDGSSSSDPDGTIASYAWTFGDGATATGAQAQHTYAAAGTYSVSLTVTDDKGATGTVSHDVTVTAPPNKPPTASFTTSASGLTVTVDGSASSDPDGSVASWAWNFGDGTTGSGPTASHTYAAGGSYTVGLTVTDNQGATGTSSSAVTVTAPAGATVVASDSFNRTVTGGLGTADVGGAWTSQGPTRLSVTPGAAVMQLTSAMQNTGAYLGSVQQTSADIRTTLVATATPTGSGTYIYVSGRRVNGVGDYRARVRLLADGRVALALSRLVGTTEAFPGGEIILSGLTYTPGTPLNVHVQMFGTGTTTIRASVWTTGTEPATWQMVRTDTTAGLQVNGGVGLMVHRPSDTTANQTVRFTGYTVTAAQ